MVKYYQRSPLPVKYESVLPGLEMERLDLGRTRRMLPLG